MKAFLQKVMAGQALGESEASDAMAVVMEGQATPAQIGALLGAIAARGETEDEVVGFARAMRARAPRVRSTGAVDTCGTGGDGAGTFNISTLASLVVAACGVPVAKHGNRSASGRCGSADVLEALGIAARSRPRGRAALARRVRLDLPVRARASTPRPGTRWGRARSWACARRSTCSVRSTNPAFPDAQVVGVPRPELTAFMARCLARLGVRRAWVVHGAGLDEISLCAPTQVTEFADGAAPRTLTITPRGRRPRALRSRSARGRRCRPERPHRDRAAGRRPRPAGRRGRAERGRGPAGRGPRGRPRLRRRGSAAAPCAAAARNPSSNA